MLLSIFLSILILALLVFVHEFGHFIVAKWSGMEVEEFSVGFPPRLLSKKIGGTNYCLSATLLGGYVKIKGMDITQTGPGSENDFSKQPIYKRAAVIVAGPAVNILLPFLLIPITLFLTTQTKDAFLYAPPVVGQAVVASPLETKDKILAIDQEPISNFVEFYQKIDLALPTEKVFNLLVERDGSELEFQLNQDQLEFDPFIKPVIGEIIPDSPAEMAGLQTGDIVLAVDQQPTEQWADLVQLILQSEGRELSLAVQRGPEQLILNVTPRMRVVQDSSEDSSTEQEKQQPELGIRAEQIKIQYGFLESISNGLTTAVRILQLNFYALGQLFTGQLSFEDVGGPVMIVKSMSDVGQHNPAALWIFAAFLSIQLAIINLLPLPVLDGGLLLFLLIEKIRKKPFLATTYRTIQQFGIVFLLALLFTLTVKDIFSVFS